MPDRLRDNILALAASNLGSVLLAFGLSVLIGRVLGEDGLGTYAAALAWVFPASLLVEFGLGTLITREVAQSPEQRATYRRAVTVQRFVMGGGMLLLLIAAAPLLSRDPDVQRGLTLAAPLVLINPLYGMFTALLRADQHMRPIAVMNVGMLATQITLTALVFVAGGDVFAALAVNTLTSAGQLAAAWLWVRRLTPDRTQPVSPSTSFIPTLRTTGQIMRRSYPFAVAAVLAAIYTRAGLIVLENSAGTEAVGLYAAASRIIDGLRTLPNALFMALLPALAALVTQPDALRRLVWRMLAALAVFGLVCAVLLTVIGPLLLVLLYGERFADAGPVLVVGGWALIPALLRSGITIELYARGREAYTNRVTALVLLIYVGLCLVLIPAYGVIGAALALLLSEGLALVLLLPGRAGGTASRDS